ncbi:YceI family protein [Corynebacterium ulceribovis]|uniref:YceI family protein n=1 Tax=Corynebacterium ulceribovis TaxID=487732 RepID=UPI0003632BC3|nr:YceI family protein [Corynebacterium ulceribovis]
MALNAEFAGTWNVDPSHSTIGFMVRHAMVSKVRGQFNDYEASFTINAEDPAASAAKAVIKAASANTNNADRDGHIQGDDFFAVEKFPEITFVATKFEQTGETTGKMTGDLTIRDHTNPVTLDVETFGVAVDAFGTTRLGLEANGEINRKDFGIDWQAPLNAGGLMVSEKVKLEIEVSATKAE